MGKKNDAVNHPKHYTAHPSGVECIEITESLSFCLGNAVKYIWRRNDKNKPIQDLKKAKWYIEREVSKRHHSAPGVDSLTKLFRFGCNEQSEFFREAVRMIFFGRTKDLKTVSSMIDEEIRKLEKK